MSEVFEALQLPFNQRALLAAVLIGAVNGYFSCYVILRKSALFTGALSHSLLPGTAIGFLLFGVSAMSAFAGSIMVSLVTGLGALAIAASSRIDKDAALPILCTSSFAMGLLLLDNIDLNIELDGFLFGNILLMSNTDLFFSFGVDLVVFVVLVLFQRPLLVFLFQPEIAQVQGIRVNALSYLLMVLLVMVLITSLQAVGAILALGLLVAPGAITYLYVDSPRALLWGGALVGVLLTVGGLLLSLLFEARTGAVIVLFSGAVFFLSFLFSPKYGLLVQFRRSHK